MMPSSSTHLRQPGVSGSSQSMERARAFTFSPTVVNEETGGQEENYDEHSVIDSNARPGDFIGQFKDPIDKLDKIFQYLTEYKIDANSAASVAPKLARTIDFNNPVQEQARAVAYAHKLARNQATRLGLVSCPKLIRQLIALLQATQSDAIRTDTALCLQLLVKTKTGAKVVWEELGIPVLVKMLRHPSELIYTTALYMLNQLMTHLPQAARPEVRSCGGHDGLAQLLREDRLTEVNWIVICVDSIRMTVYRDSDTKIALLQTNLHIDLIRLLRVYCNHPKVAFNVTRLIKVLGTCNMNKTKLVENGAVEALTTLLQSKNELLQLETLWSLRNLSDHAFHLTNTRTLINSLIDLLGSTDENISICSVGCLCNLTCQNAHNKGLVVEAGGVTRLCQLLNLNPDRQEITEPLCSALRHVTHRGPHSNAAIYEVVTSRTVPTIASLLDRNDEPSVLPLLKSVIGLVRNLAADDAAREQLRSLGVTKSLAHILRQTYKSVKSIEPNPDSDIDEAEPIVGCIEGVRLEDMLELCLIALQAIAKDEGVHNELVHTAGLLTTVVQLLYPESIPIQRATVAFLSQLSVSKVGARSIEQEGACPRLTELIQSNNEYIAAYSAAVLHRITKDKPDAYRRRLSLELRQALFDGGLLLKSDRDLSDTDDMPVTHAASMSVRSTLPESRRSRTMDRF